MFLIWSVLRSIVFPHYTVKRYNTCRQKMKRESIWKRGGKHRPQRKQKAFVCNERLFTGELGVPSFTR